MKLVYRTFRRPEDAEGWDLVEVVREPGIIDMATGLRSGSCEEIRVFDQPSVVYYPLYLMRRWVRESGDE